MRYGVLRGPATAPAVLPPDAMRAVIAHRHCVQPLAGWRGRGGSHE